MATIQSALPGIGFINETNTIQSNVPGVGGVNETTQLAIIIPVAAQSITISPQTVTCSTSFKRRFPVPPANRVLQSQPHVRRFPVVR